MELRLDDLQLDGLKMYQFKDGYNFTSDSVLLANFVSCKHKDICVEIGTGSGVISILVSHKQKPKNIYAFELQSKYANLAQKNIDFNKIENITVINDDVLNFKKHLSQEVDVVFCNPPYFDGEFKSAKKEVAICKHQKFLPMEKLIVCAKDMLKFGGSFFVVYPAQNISKLIYLLTKHNLMPKKMFFAQPKENKNANTVYIMCKKGGKEGTLVLPTLITNNDQGDYVMTIQKLYRDKEVK